MAVNRNKVLEAARKYLARGQYDKAIAQYQKLVDDDAGDVRSLLKIGDMQTRKGDRTTAAQTYQRVADHYAARGFFLKAVAVYKQILKLDPARLDIQVRLGEMYEQLQLISDAMTTYEDVANSCMRAGETDRGLSMLAKMVDLDSEHIPVRIKYAEALSRSGHSDAAASEFERGASLLKTQGRIDDYVKVSERLLFHRDDDIDLARELARTYLERNDPKRALAKLQICFKANPRDVPTLELLCEAFQQLGQKDKTISVYREIARIHREAERTDERIAILQRILEIDPADSDAKRALESTLGRSPNLASTPMSASPSAEIPSEASPPNNGVPDNDGVVYLDEDEVIESLPPDSLELLPPDTLDSIPTGFEDTVIGAEPAPALQDTYISTPPALGTAAATANRQADFEPISYEKFQELPLMSTGTDTYVAPQPNELERSLETTAHYIRQGMLEAARGIVSNLQVSLPVHPLVEARAAEIDLMLLTSAGVSSLPAAQRSQAPQYPQAITSGVKEKGFSESVLKEDEDQSFAIAEKLADELADAGSFDDGEDVLDVEAVFDQFKKGVAEQVAIDDSDTHFDLGIAYKEMGLLEDARREFQVAMSSPTRQCLCWTMIGLCYMEEGRATDAIEAFQSGLDIEVKTESEELGLFFEVGVANEAAGRTAEAVKFFERVYARDPQFREVSKRLAELQSAGRPRKPRSLDNIDDLDQAFDDLIKLD